MRATALSLSLADRGAFSGPASRSPVRLWEPGDMGSPKRRRQRANRQARREAQRPIPVVTDADLEGLLADVTVRDDCEHAVTRATADGVVLLRCTVGAAVPGGCPRDCASFERRRVGGLGL